MCTSKLRRLKTVTFDSTAEPNSAVVLAAINAGWHVAFVSVSVREAQFTDFCVEIKKHDLVPELGVWEESSWDEARWADESSGDRLEKILAIISNSGFPKSRNQLSEGQRHQLRDAMILEAHVAAERTTFVTDDLRAFITHGRRERLENLLSTRILSSFEFKAKLCNENIGSE